MAQVNKTIYPDVGGNTYFTSTLVISPANFPDHLISGLDTSITYSMSTNERAPMRDVRSCYMTSDHPGAVYHYHTSDPQRVAICYGWNPNCGDKCGTEKIMSNPWGENFMHGTFLVSAIKFNSIIGRLLCVWGIADDYDAIATKGHISTWKDFQNYCVAHPTENIVLLSAWIEDVQFGGVGPRTRNNPAKALNLRNMALCRWADSDSQFSQLTDMCFQYEALRPMSFMQSFESYNGCQCNAANNPDMVWPVYNYGYGVSGASPNAPTYPYGTIGAFIVYGVEEGISDDLYTLSWPNMGQAQGSWIYGMSVLKYGKETLFNYIEEKAATYGIMFVTDMKVASSGDGGFAPNSLQYVDVSNPSTIPNIVIPTINGDGNYDGTRIYTGDDVPDKTQGLIDGDKDTTFDEGASSEDPTPGPEPDPEIPDDNTYTDHVDMTNPTLTATGIFNRTYIMNADGVADLADWIYNADDNVFEEIMKNLFTNNPIEALINLRLYPFDVASIGQHGAAEFIKMGRTVSSVSGLKLPSDATAVIDMGRAAFPKFFKNWLDYEIEAQLYIPFIGTIDLPVPQCLNHYISVKLVVDYVTGAATAVIYADRIPILYKQGVIGIDIPMTATNSAETSKAIIGNIVGAIGAGAQGNAMGAVEQSASAFLNAVKGSHLQTAGSSSPQNSLYQPKNCYLLLSLPAEYENAWSDLQGETNGYACYIPCVVGDMVNGGYAEFDNVRLDRCGNATDKEKEMIQDYLNNGVYL